MAAVRVHKEEIKAELRIAHGSLKAFEAKQGLPEGSVKDVLRGRSSSPTEKAIASALKRPLHELFPSRYPDESSLKVDHSDVSRRVHRLTAGAR